MIRLLISTVFILMTLLGCEMETPSTPGGSGNESYLPSNMIPENQNLEFYVDGKKLISFDNIMTLDLGRIDSASNLNISKEIKVKNNGKKDTRISFSSSPLSETIDIKYDSETILAPDETAVIKVDAIFPKDKGFQSGRIMTLYFWNPSNPMRLEILAEKNDVPMLRFQYSKENQFQSFSVGSIDSYPKNIRIRDFHARKSNELSLRYEFLNKDKLFRIDSISLEGGDAPYFKIVSTVNDTLIIDFTPDAIREYTINVELRIISEEGEIFERSFACALDVEHIDNSFFAYNEAFWSSEKGVNGKAFAMGIKPSGEKYIIGMDNYYYRILELDTNETPKSVTPPIGSLSENIIDTWFISDTYYAIGKVDRNFKLFKSYPNNEFSSLYLLGTNYAGHTDTDIYTFEPFKIHITNSITDETKSYDLGNSLAIHTCLVNEDGTLYLAGDTTITFPHPHIRYAKFDEIKGWSDHRIPLPFNMPVEKILKDGDTLYLFGNTLNDSTTVTWLSTVDLTKIGASDCVSNPIYLDTVYTNFHVKDGFVYLYDKKMRRSNAFDESSNMLMPYASFNSNKQIVGSFISDKYMYYIGSAGISNTNYVLYIKRVPILSNN